MRTRNPNTRGRRWRVLVPLIGVLIAPCLAGAQTTYSSNWAFRKGDSKPDANTSKWEKVTIPHTWNAEDASDGGGKDNQSRDGYYRGPGWYQQRFKVDEALKGKRVFLRFEGVGSAADIYLNGHHLGQHLGAFGAFCFELTDWLEFGGENEVRVRADNTWRADLPPLSGDFPVFGGIYRPVSLIVKDAACITPLDFASPGVYITPKNVSRESARVEVLTKIDNAGSAADFDVVCTITDAEGGEVATGTEHVNAKGEATTVHRFTLENPRLWNGRKDPYLYSVQVVLKQGGAVLDTSTQPLGLRFFRVDPEKGFFLNGQPYMIYGVNRHQDRKGKGWAVSSADHAEDVALICEMGARGLRLAHFPQAGEMYGLCDKAGLLVWAEIPMVDRVSAGPEFAHNAKQQLRELIRQQYNHPSIFCWSLFNEMYHRESDEFEPLLRELNAICKEEDPQRFTAGATNKKDRVKLANVTDLLAFNAYPGWYGGGPDAMPEALEAFNAIGGKRGIGVSEYGAGASIKHHQQNPPKSVPTGKWHPEEWQAIVHEGNYASIRDCESCWGSFLWNMFDFASSWRDEGDTPGINDKGLVTYDRKVRKDAFFFYKANWSDEPVLYITSRRHVEREDAVTSVKIYSNANEVTLKVNGVAIGTKGVDKMQIVRWDGVSLAAGENVVEAEASMGDHKATDRCVWKLKPKGAN